MKDPGSTLALVSDVTAGTRLSEILRFAEAADVTLDIDAALCLLRQLVPAIALLHENMPDIAHGAIGVERLVVTPTARLIVVEHVMGSALEQLRFSQERYWRELRIAVPQSAGLPRFDHRTDVAQLGAVALSLILGRRLHDEEGPARLGDLVSSAWAVSARGGLEPLPAGLRAWMMCALQLDARNSFESAIDAQDELERVLGESDYLAAPATLESFLERYRAAAAWPNGAADEAPRGRSQLPAPEPMTPRPPEPKPFRGPCRKPGRVVSNMSASPRSANRPVRPGVRPVIVHEPNSTRADADRHADARGAALVLVASECRVTTARAATPPAAPAPVVAAAAASAPAPVATPAPPSASMPAPTPAPHRRTDRAKPPSLRPHRCAAAATVAP